MVETISTVLVTLIGVYVFLGVLFAVPFVLRGAGRLDPSAEQGSRGFRILLLPGSVALWPVLAGKWRAAVRDNG